MILNLKNIFITINPSPTADVGAGGPSPPGPGDWAHGGGVRGHVPRPLLAPQAGHGTDHWRLRHHPGHEPHRDCPGEYLIL